MRITFFVHSLLSDWNHGNAHFLRGVVTELAARGHAVAVYEPRSAWSADNLIQDHGELALFAMCRMYPKLDPIRYDPSSFDAALAVDGSDLVIVHEWNEPSLVAALGRARATGGAFRLLFHDTHHRMASAPDQMSAYDLSHYDGVLAFGSTIRDLYLERSLAQRAWTFHEAADTRIFRRESTTAEADVVFIGNWGDAERTAELREFFVDPVASLRLQANVYGVRYPDDARAELSRAGIAYRGYLPNFRAPAVFARHAITIHVPRAYYARILPGIPTIRPFEALACGIPLVCSPWDDTDHLFSAGRDFLVARDGEEMRRHMRLLLSEPAAAAELAAHGLRTILARHTCAHRVDELLAIVRSLGVPTNDGMAAHAELVPS